MRTSCKTKLMVALVFANAKSSISARRTDSPSARAFHFSSSRHHGTNPISREIKNNRVAGTLATNAQPKTSNGLTVNMSTGDGEAAIGLVGLAVMGQNLALNVAEKGFKISVFNRSSDKTDACVARAQKEGLGNNLQGFKDIKDFVASLERPRRVIILVKAGAPVDSTIEALSEHMEEGDIIIDGGNEWYENTERRQAALKSKGIVEIGMGVSGGEEGARRGPAMMPGGDAEAYKYLAPIVEKVAAQTDDGACVTYIGPGGSGNFVKMVHNGIEYGDMQLIAEAYDILKTVGGLSNEELAAVFDEWNKSELESFLVEITASIFKKKDEYAEGFLVDKVLDKTGMKVRRFSSWRPCFRRPAGSLGREKRWTNNGRRSASVRRAKMGKKEFQLMDSNHRPRGYGPRTLPLRQAERWIGQLSPMQLGGRW